MSNSGFRASMNEMDQESLRATMTQADRLAEGVARFLVTHHLVLYFSSSEERRVAIAQNLAEAARCDVDVPPSTDPHVLEWRRSWPAAARAAILAVWATPHA